MTHKNLSTGISLPRGNGEVCYGDILKSSMTHDVVVMFHADKQIPIVKVIDSEFYFPLKQFIESWGSSLKIDTNVNYYYP